MNGSTTMILVVEDNDLDVENVRRCFERMGVANPIVRAKDGLEGLDVLRGQVPQSDLKRPYIVLLDLNMPRMNGIEFLEAIREDDAIADTPVFVLTTSDHRRDVQAAYRQNVCGYIVKPLRRAEMMEALSMVNAYCQICKLPLERQSVC